MLKRFQESGLLYLGLSLLVFILDWSSKTWADTYLILYSPVAIAPSFNVTLAYNTGAAFSFLSEHTAWSNLFFSGVALTVSIGLLVWLACLSRREVLLNTGLALIIGGALGNLWDRFHYGHVIDFIDLYLSTWHWPVFNVADIAVSLGAFLILWKWTVRQSK